MTRTAYPDQERKGGPAEQPPRFRSQFSVPRSPFVVSHTRGKRSGIFGIIPAFLLLAAYLLFAHGCHPHDEDDEPLATARHLISRMK